MELNSYLAPEKYDGECLRKCILRKPYGIFSKQPTCKIFNVPSIPGCNSKDIYWEVIYDFTNLRKPGSGVIIDGGIDFHDLYVIELVHSFLTYGTLDRRVGDKLCSIICQFLKVQLGEQKYANYIYLFTGSQNHLDPNLPSPFENVHISHFIVNLLCVNKDNADYINLAGWILFELLGGKLKHRVNEDFIPKLPSGKFEIVHYLPRRINGMPRKRLIFIKNCIDRQCNGKFLFKLLKFAFGEPTATIFTEAHPMVTDHKSFTDMISQRYRLSDISVIPFENSFKLACNGKAYTGPCLKCFMQDNMKGPDPEMQHSSDQCRTDPFQLFPPLPIEKQLPPMPSCPEVDDDEIEISPKLDCAVCMESEINTLLIPCGHTLCDKCTDRVKICPICRAQIVSTHHIHL